VLNKLPRFPPEFRFGVATADHQCEAYPGQDDIRDVWERVRGITPRGKATDFWNRYREDVDLAKGLGCRAFRVSLSWARLEPQAGSWDAGAFQHYRELLQYMRDAGMATVVTLHHNTWPLHVQAAGNGAGMLDPGFPDRFAAYASVVAERLGDLIDYYVTINEPNQLVYGFVKLWCMRCYAMPPGLPPFATGADQMEAVLRLIPNLFRAHARAREAIRRIRPDALVGTNPLVLGLPRWLQRWFDRSATRLRNAGDLHAQAARMSQTRMVDSGKVDISVAQVTITQSRMGRVNLSEPYFVAHLAALHASSTLLPEDLAGWTGRAGVVRGGAPEEQSAHYLPAAAIREYASVGAAVQALRRGELDAVVDDDVVLRGFAGADLRLTILPAHDQNFAVAMALGSRALLNAVDIAIREFKAGRPEAPRVHNRKTVAHIGRESIAPMIENLPDLDDSLRRIRRRGVLRVGVSPGIPGLCMRDPSGAYTGLEPDLARHIASRIFGERGGEVRFVPVHGDRRVGATRSWLQKLDGVRKSLAVFTTILGTNWWNLGLAGRLAPFLCPRECVGALDYVGIDYYWGVPSVLPWQLERLVAAADASYGKAPVWPSVLFQILREQQQQFPGKPIIVIENGCVTRAEGVPRADYITRHVLEVQRAVAEGIPVEAYLCWSITSNREWGLPFDDNSDFGLYHIDLDRDPNLTRVPTAASRRYAEIIAARSADVPFSGRG
jgi:beta-glucosidase/6-phospho-beta-glucosidase/beta-galactosidase/ABC-type amino acid transport substrate-binding protein